MTEPRLRVQLVSDPESIEALEQVARADSVATEPVEVRSSDQRFGLAEVAAVVAIVHTAAQVAELLAKSFATIQGKKKVMVKTPKGSVTIECDVSTSAPAILQQILAAGVV